MATLASEEERKEGSDSSLIIPASQTGSNGSRHPYVCLPLREFQVVFPNSTGYHLMELQEGAAAVLDLASFYSQSSSLLGERSERN